MNVIQVDLDSGRARTLGSRFAPTWRDYSNILLWACGSALTGVPALYCAARYWEKEQRRRNERARELGWQLAQAQAVDLAQRRATRPFVLYLRPFAYTNGFHVSAGIIPFTWRFFREPSVVAIDEYLGSCLKSSETLLICLGHDGDQLGAGRIETSDEKWWEYFLLLSEHADGIVVIPGIQEGIAREISWLKASGLLEKTLFLKPKGYSKDGWKKVTEFYQEHERIDMPDWVHGQMSFRISSWGFPTEIRLWVRLPLPFLRGGDRQMASFLKGTE